MHLVEKTLIKDFEQIPIDEFWNVGAEKELKMHSIHAYPAKFPAFLTKKALEHISKLGINPKVIADVFCGCGTVAYEAKREDIDFWGCDINPVATMIARAKSAKYSENKLIIIFNKLTEIYEKIEPEGHSYYFANERLTYWYFEKQFLDLIKLKLAIEEVLKNHPKKYHDFFICAVRRQNI